MRNRRHHRHSRTRRDDGRRRRGRRPGTAGRGGTTGTAGTTGSAGTGGARARAGTTGTAGTPAPAAPPSPPAPSRSGRGARARALNPNPFGCTFAWGRQNPSGSGSLSSYNYLQMVAYWIESGVRRRHLLDCSGCTWLSSRVSGTNLIPVYYAYMIGYYGHMNGLPDQNTDPNGANLSTGGAALI